MWFHYKIMEGIMGVLKLWGYSPVATPTFEYAEFLSRGYGRELDDKMYKFMDRDGRILALRPEMTTPVARLCATKLNLIAPLPWRLCYSAPVFQYQPSGIEGLREMFQIGAELIGSHCLAADAEVIALAVQALKGGGLSNFQVNLGHVGFLSGILESSSIPKNLRQGIKTALQSHDFVTLEHLLEKTKPLSPVKDLLLGFPTLCGKHEILERARKQVQNKRSLAALEQLEEVYSQLQDYDIGDILAIDLSLMRDLDFYTGTVFEIYHPRLGSPLCAGGRYDHLVERFGVSHPATGFAIFEERLEQVLDFPSLVSTDVANTVVIVGDSDNPRASVQLAQRLRSAGFISRIFLEDCQKSDPINYARSRGNNLLLRLTSNGKVTIQKPPSSQKKTCSLDEVEATLESMMEKD